MLYIFQLLFLLRTEKSVLQIENGKMNCTITEDIHDLTATFQQQYRDYIDIAKLAQMIPVIGAAVGAIANYN
jgi:hypothetical protein